jgi:hypothetical protein
MLPAFCEITLRRRLRKHKEIGPVTDQTSPNESTSEQGYLAHSASS